MAFRTTPENMSTISSVAGVVRLGGKSNARKSDVLPLGGGGFLPPVASPHCATDRKVFCSIIVQQFMFAVMHYFCLLDIVFWLQFFYTANVLL